MADDLIARLRSEVERASAALLEEDHWDGVADHLAQWARRGSVVVAPVVAERAPQLLEQVRDRGLAVVVPEGTDSEVMAAVADADIGVVAGELAVAESGSVLVAEHALGDRVVSMLSRRLVVVVPREAVAAALEDAAAWLAAHAGGTAWFASLMTGPSRTADIERSLTIGVQGPDEVDVVLCAAASNAARPLGAKGAQR